MYNFRLHFIRVLSLFIFLLVGSANAEPKSYSLDDCYRLSLAQSESLERKSEDIKAAEARYQELVSLLYPQIDASVTQRIRNSSSFSGSSSSGDFGDNNSRSTGKHPFETSLGVRQPIFSGFRDLLLTEAGEKEIRASEYERKRHAELLYLDLSDVFHQIVYYQNDLNILRKTEKVLNERILELQDFIRLGKARESEIQAAASDLADVGATKARVDGLLGASKEVLAFLTGKNSSELLLARAPQAPITDSVDALLDKAKDRADLQASLLRSQAASKEFKAAERERWPSLSLEGNYYPYENPENVRDWDVLFRLDIPIFEGGGIDARISQSLSKQRTAELSNRETGRLIEKEVRVAYNDLRAAQTETARLKGLLSAARKNYQSQQEDYKLGVVTNLEVLSAIRNVQNAERRLLEVETTAQINQAKLQVAVGGIP